MHRTDFAYDLPKDLIASYPAPERAGSRLLYLNAQTGQIQNRQFCDFLDLLNPGDLLVLNNTKVFPARLYGQKASGGKIEVLVERVLDDRHALVHCKASKRPKIGSTLILEKEIKTTVLEDKSTLLKLQFEQNIFDLLSQYGHIPLPSYMEREDEEIDKLRYQTIYAKEKGSVAAPTAGLHFDEKMLEKIKNKKINITEVTLHVGAGTFQPVRVEKLDDHIMHAEYGELSQETAKLIQETKKNKKRIIAVGTTSVRVLETANQKPFTGDTQLFIKPGYQFNTVDAILTNFHLSESTLLMLVCAFGGYDNTIKAYKEAVENKYRFFSYGDAMFIAR